MIFEWDFLVFVAALGVAAFSPGLGLAASLRPSSLRAPKRSSEAHNKHEKTLV